MDVFELRYSLTELIRQGYGDQEVIAYIQTEGEPLEVVEVHYDEDSKEVNLALIGHH